MPPVVALHEARLLQVNLRVQLLLGGVVVAGVVPGPDGDPVLRAVGRHLHRLLLQFELQPEEPVVVGDIVQLTLLQARGTAGEISLQVRRTCGHFEIVVGQTPGHDGQTVVDGRDAVAVLVIDDVEPDRVDVGLAGIDRLVEIQRGHGLVARAVLGRGVNDVTRIDVDAVGYVRVRNKETRIPTRSGALLAVEAIRIPAAEGLQPEVGG